MFVWQVSTTHYNGHIRNGMGVYSTKEKAFAHAEKEYNYLLLHTDFDIDNFEAWAERIIIDDPMVYEIWRGTPNSDDDNEELKWVEH